MVSDDESVDDTLMCSFQILKPVEKRQRVMQASEAASRPHTPPAARAQGRK